MTPQVLVIDDEELFREDLAGLLRRRGLQCLTAGTGQEGLAIVQKLEPDVVLCDVKMPGLGGIETLDEIMRLSPATSVIMVTAYGELDTAIMAFRRGAHDYLMKPVIVEDVLAKIQRLMDHRQLANEVKLLRRQLAREGGTSAPIGQSEAMKNVLKLVDDVSSTRSTVLLSGESGTGKEVVARAIHERGGRGRRRSFPSTARAYRKACLRASFSDTSEELSPAR